MSFRQFVNYLTGLPDDSAFISKMRRPHEERQAKLDELRQMTPQGARF